jgi:hypothetical protein
MIQDKSNDVRLITDFAVFFHHISTALLTQHGLYLHVLTTFR